MRHKLFTLAISMLVFAFAANAQKMNSAFKVPPGKQEVQKKMDGKQALHETSLKKQEAEKLEKAKPLLSNKATQFIYRSNEDKGVILDESFETWPPTDWDVTDWSQSDYGAAHTGSEWAY